MTRKNPASVVKTRRDERLWEMAKQSAEEQGRAEDWAYTMGTFQRMQKRVGGGDLPPNANKKSRAKKTRKKTASRKNPPNALDEVKHALRGTGYRLDSTGRSQQRAKIRLTDGSVVEVAVRLSA